MRINLSIGNEEKEILEYIKKEHYLSGLPDAIRFCIRRSVDSNDDEEEDSNEPLDLTDPRDKQRKQAIIERNEAKPLNTIPPEIAKLTMTETIAMLNNEGVNEDENKEERVLMFMNKGATRAQAEQYAQMEMDADGNPIYV